MEFLKAPRRHVFLLRAVIIIFYDVYLFSQIEVIRRTKTLLCVNNDYTKVTKDYVEFRTGRKRKKRRKTKKLVS